MNVKDFWLFLKSGSKYFAFYLLFKKKKFKLIKKISNIITNFLVLSTIINDIFYSKLLFFYYYYYYFFKLSNKTIAVKLNNVSKYILEKSLNRSRDI